MTTLVDEENGLDAYTAYFTDSPTPTDHVAYSYEFTHYNDILRDDRWSNVQAYLTNKESHVQNLLNKFERFFVKRGFSCRQ